MTTYKSEIELVEGTFGKEVNLQAQDEEGKGINLTGCAVVWKIWEADATDLRLKATCAPVELTEGKVKYLLKEADWAVNRLEASKDYMSSLTATKAGYNEEFIEFKVKTIKKSPENLKE